MKNSRVFFIGLLLFSVGLAAQDPVTDEIRETLRFVRLAETKKRLSFDEDTLIKVNEILDGIEARKFELVIRERGVREQLRGGNVSEDEVDRALDEMIALKKENLANEERLWQQIRELLTPREALEFFVFYDKFTRDVKRRIRMLREQRGKGGRLGEGRPNHRRFRNQD